MNIFVLDSNPSIAAEMHCDKHVPKMIIEHAQMMAAAYYSTLGISRKKEISGREAQVASLFSGWPRKKPDGSEWYYAISHINHPCTVWTRESLDNFYWVLQCTEGLCREFEKRWNKKHKIAAIVEWMYSNPPVLPSKNITPFAKAMPLCYQTEDAILSYRKYYAFKTTYMKVQWKRLNTVPDWWTPELIQTSIESFIPNPEPPKKKRNVKI